MVIQDRHVWLAIAGLLGLFGLYALNDWRQARESRLFGEQVLQPLQNPYFKDKGYWVGDVAELYRLGKISREVAEADTAPLHPLVPKPVPFHGYFVRAMESGPADFDNQPPTSFKGRTWSQGNFAILIYPEHPAAGKRTWMTGLGLRFRNDAWTPVFSFPTDQELKMYWGIVD